MKTQPGSGYISAGISDATADLLDDAALSSYPWEDSEVACCSDTTFPSRSPFSSDMQSHNHEKSSGDFGANTGLKSQNALQLHAAADSAS